MSSSSSSSDQDALKLINKSREQMKQLLQKAMFDEEESNYRVLPTCMRRIFNRLMKSSVSSDQINEAMKQINKSLEEIKQLLLKAKSESEEEENKYSVPTCMRILNDMKISFKRNEAYVDVMKSFEKKGWREVFVNMSEEQRKVWIDTVKKYNNVVDRQRGLDIQRLEEKIWSLRVNR